MILKMIVLFILLHNPLVKYIPQNIYRYTRCTICTYNSIPLKSNYCLLLLSLTRPPITNPGLCSADGVLRCIKIHFLTIKSFLG